MTVVGGVGVSVDGGDGWCHLRKVAERKQNIVASRVAECDGNLKLGSCDHNRLPYVFCMVFFSV